jgi:cyclohexa-1,5-dienecarbonyl-CoA hydratase
MNTTDGFLGHKDMSDFEFLQVKVDEGIVRITLNRPPLNVLHNPMMAELNSALETLTPNAANLAAIVIEASGKAFSAGVDVADHTEDKVAEMIHLFHGIFRQLASTDALTIAAVAGAALGGGCELACFCDIVLASDRAKFGQPEVKVGVFPPVAACSFASRIGLGKAIELVALGEVIAAGEAHRIGLINQVYPADEFASHVEQYLVNIRQLSRPVVRLSKRATVGDQRQRTLSHLALAEQIYLDDLMEVADAHEGIAAFLQKRTPNWRHE